MTTIVSAFISNVNKREDRTATDYYAFGKWLLNSTTPKIIFVDDTMYNLIQNSNYNKENTLVLKYHKEDIYLYHYKDNLTHFYVDTNNSLKDTWEYMFTMCNKTEFIRQAIKCDPFGSTHFIWVDFGIKHVFRCSDDLFVEKLNQIHLKKQHNKVRIGNIWNLDATFRVDLMTRISWYFAGGIFGGDRSSLLRFSDLMKDKCTEIINNHHSITWEVNIWYMIYKENQTLFDPYMCDHNDTILDNY